VGYGYRATPKSIASMKYGVVLAAVIGGGFLLATDIAQAEFQGSDAFENTGPGSLVSGSMLDRYPSGRFALDSYIDQGIGHPSGWGASVLQLLTALTWGITQLLVRCVIQLLGWAFTGSMLVGPHGALAPIADAIERVHEAIGDPWLFAGLAAAGIWGIWRGLVQRRFTDAFAGLGMSVVLVVVAMFFVLRPIQTISFVTNQVDEASLAFLAIGSTGTTDSPQEARRAVVDTLFEAQILRPWTVLQFGGTKVCTHATRTNSNTSPVTGARVPMPVAPGQGAVCRDAVERYAPRYLAQAPISDARQAEYEALRDGSVESPDAQDHAEPGQFVGYRVDERDMPSVDMQQEGGSVGRLVYAIGIAFASLGFLVLMGVLVLVVVLAQVLAMVLLAFSPVALVAAAIPGRGHDLMRGWLLKLMTALVVKCVFALLIGIVVTVGGALASATAELGFLFAFGLQAMFYWGLFFGRRWLIAKATPLQPRIVARAEHHQHTAATMALGAVTRPVSAMTGRRKQERLSAPERDSTIDEPRRTSKASNDPVPSELARRAGEQKRAERRSDVADRQPVASARRADSTSPPASAGRDYSPALARKPAPDHVEYRAQPPAVVSHEEPVRQPKPHIRVKPVARPASVPVGDGTNHATATAGRGAHPGPVATPSGVRREGGGMAPPPPVPAPAGSSPARPASEDKPSPRRS